MPVPLLWENDYLARISLKAEIEISRATTCIIDRIAIPVIVGESEFKLPDYVYNVRKVYWKGYRLEPIATLSLSETGLEIDGIVYGGYGAAGGQPREYFYNGFGDNKIKLNPAANEVLGGGWTDGLWSYRIPTTVIVEFYRFADGIDWVIPPYLRRRTIKAYVCWKAFQKEGDGQNNKAAEYWKAKYYRLLARAKLIIDATKRAIVPIRPEHFYTERREVPRPVLPPNWRVETVYEDESY
jgi:hypothetical protein